MRRLALILILFGLADPLGRGDPNPVDALFQQARDAEKAAKWDDEIQLDEKIITGRAEDMNRWFEAESNIVHALAKKGDFAAAAQHAHLCLDAAPNLQAFDDAVRLAAGVLSAGDKNVDRANQFLAFEQSGAAGKANPMDAVGYPSLPAREAAFAAFRQEAGEDAPASRLRAYTYLFQGKPREALAQFSDAFRRNTNPYDFTNGGVELVTIGLRAARGNRVGLDQAMQFVIHGPNGPDDKPNTPDDIADPFAGLMDAPPAPGGGGLAGIDPASLAALHKVNDAAKLYGGDALAPIDVNHALGALERSNNALDNWGAPGQVDWYLQRELGLGCPPPSEYTGGYLTGLYFASRGRNNHYGGFIALWSECAAHNIKLIERHRVNWEKLHSDFENNMANLARLQFPKLDFQPLKAPVSF